MSCPCNLAVLQHLRRPWSSPPGCGDISWSSSNSFYNYYNNSTIVKCWKIFNCLNLSLICLCGGWTLSSLIECLAAQWHHEVSPSWPSSSSVIISIGARNRWFEMNVGNGIGFTVANESKPCQQCHPHGRKISQRHHRLNRLDLPERGPCQSHRPRPAPICTQWFFSVSCSRKDQKDVINETKNCVCVFVLIVHGAPHSDELHQQPDDRLHLESIRVHKIQAPSRSMMSRSPVQWQCQIDKAV